MKYLLPLIFCGFLLASCSSPEPQYYTLSAIPGGSRGNSAPRIEIRRPVIPVTLDKPEMVSQSTDFQVQENEGHVWSEPLDTMIERVLAEDMRARFPHGMVVTESGGESVKNAYAVDIDMEQFGTDAQGDAFLQAEIIVRSSTGKEKSMPIALHGEPVTSAESMARNLSILLGRLCDTLSAAFE